MDGDGAGPADPDQVWTVYDGANPYMDFDGEGQLQARYLYGPGIDELFARIGTGEDPEWFLTDRLGSVRQIVDASGTVLDDIGYDSFGGILSETNPVEGDRFKFTGREYCQELGLYYYRARWYDPAVGRFISQDPIGFQAGDPNLYRYVGNAPGDGTDPNGLAPKLILRPDGSSIWINIPDGQDPNKFVEKFYPGSIIHGSQDKEILKNPNLIPFLPQPKDPPTQTFSNSQFWSASDFADIVLGIAGFFYEPLDWALTLNEIKKDPTNYWNYLGFIPGLSIGMVKGCKKIKGTVDNLETMVLGFPFKGPNAPAQAYKHLQKYHGIDPTVASNRLHKIKQKAGLGAADDVIIGKTGDIYNAKTGERLGSLTDKTLGQKD